MSANFTYSIIAIDKERNEIGAAVQSHAFCAGLSVPWVQTNIGALVTQASVTPELRAAAIELLESGDLTQHNLENIVAKHLTGAETQIALMDVSGNIAAYTGHDCLAFAGHYIGDSCSAQGNLLAQDQVWRAMGEAYSDSQGKDLGERLLVALDIAQDCSGDFRGKRSAGLRIVQLKSESKPGRYTDSIHDLRVDDHAEPLIELRRLYKISCASRKWYNAMEILTVNASPEDQQDSRPADLNAVYNQSLTLYQQALTDFNLLSKDTEWVQFWYAVQVAKSGKLAEAEKLISKVLKHNSRYIELLNRLQKNNSYQYLNKLKLPN
ncbi:MAG TPA: DUF1028 domain-containing protein [Gammaproteobacteria bacterium]